MSVNDTNLSARSRLMFGSAGAAILVVAILAAVIAVVPSDTGTSFTAVFGHAGQGMDPRSDVKIRGVTVGGVQSVTLQPDGRAKVRFRVQKGVRIPTSAVARIEPVSVFGPKDLLIEPGTGEGTGPYLQAGGAVTQTKDPQDLSDTAWPAYRLTQAIDPQDVATVLHTFSQGLSGEGPALRRTIDNGSKLIGLAHDNRQQIRQLIADVAGISDTMANRGDTLVGIASDFNQLSPVITDRPDKIDELLTGASKLSDNVGNILDKHGTDIGKLVDGAGRAVDVFYEQRRNIPVMLDGLVGFFATLAEIIRVPGPNKSMLAQALNYLPTDICKVILDVCGTSKSAKSALSLASTARKGR